MLDNELLVEWPELKRAIAEGRCELSLTSVPAGDRNPAINDKQLQGKIFAPVSFTHYKKGSPFYSFTLFFSFARCIIESILQLGYFQILTDIYLRYLCMSYK